MEVDGDLKVTGTVESATIDSLNQRISELEIMIAQLQAQMTNLLINDDCSEENPGIQLLDACNVCDGGNTDTDNCPNYALSFDGEDDYVDCGNDSSFNITEEITILTWAKKNASDATNWLVSKNRDMTGGYHLFYPSDQSISGKVNTSNGGVASCSYPYSGNNEWEYIAFTYNKDFGAKLYLNSTLVDYADANGIIDIDQNVSNFNIGRLDWDGGLYEFNGFMDNLSIFNRELSHEEIQANMYSDFPVNEEGLVAYWNFNESIGSTLNDLSGNGNHGTIHGATWVERE